MFAKMMERENERQRETERERNETYVGRDMGFVNNMGSADVLIILLSPPLSLLFLSSFFFSLIHISISRFGFFPDEMEFCPIFFCLVLGLSFSPYWILSLPLPLPSCPLLHFHTCPRYLAMAHSIKLYGAILH